MVEERTGSYPEPHDTFHGGGDRNIEAANLVFSEIVERACRRGRGAGDEDRVEAPGRGFFDDERHEPGVVEFGQGDFQVRRLCGAGRPVGDTLEKGVAGHFAENEVFELLADGRTKARSGQQAGGEAGSNQHDDGRNVGGVQAESGREWQVPCYGSENPGEETDGFAKEEQGDQQRREKEDAVDGHF